MNVYDSERMMDILKPLGYEATDSQDDADMMLFNTCHIREKASEKLYSDLGRAKPFKEKRAEKGQKTLIAVAGCTAQAEGAEVIKRAPYVDMVFGPQTYHELPQMIALAHRQMESDEKGKKRGVVNTDFPEESKFDHLPSVTKPEGPTSYLSIQEGCDKFCHFCVVPYTRGAEFSRPTQDIVAEANKLVALGVKEITLLGQNVSAYHGLGENDQEHDMTDLIEMLSQIQGLDRIRYTTSHPRDMDQKLFDAHGNIEKLMPYLHLPVQSGSNAILKAMNRKHTREQYFEIVDKFREKRPDIAFSSDFIVGYPGESDQDFEDTMDLVRQVNYAQAYSFKYSRRPGTPGASLPRQVPEEVKDQRLQALQALLREQQTEFNHDMIGRTLPVLFERLGRHQGQIIGKSPYLQSVHITASERLLGTIQHVKINAASSNSLTGEMVLGEYETSDLKSCAA